MATSWRKFVFCMLLTILGTLVRKQNHHNPICFENLALEDLECSAFNCDNCSFTVYVYVDVVT